MNPFRIQNSTELLQSMATVGEKLASCREAEEASITMEEDRRGHAIVKEGREGDWVVDEVPERGKRGAGRETVDARAAGLSGASGGARMKT